MIIANTCVAHRRNMTSNNTSLQIPLIKLLSYAESWLVKQQSYRTGLHGMDIDVQVIAARRYRQLR